MQHLHYDNTEKINYMEIKPAYNDEKNTVALFTEYTTMLSEVRSDIKNYLDLQNYGHELTNLNAKYGLPHGRLYIAYIGGKAAGCIAFRKLNNTECEMKRLYIRPRYRKMGIANALANKLINEAKKAGYQYMLLDTLPELKAALYLYEKLGFYRIPPYNDSPVTNTVFMKLNL